MQRKRDGLVPIGEVFGSLGGPIQAIRKTQRCCMDHPEGCLIIVFSNTGDNLDAT